MAEPTNAERVNRYFRSIGIAPRARRAPRPELEDDDIDVEIGAARIEPEEDLDVQFGDAQVEDDDIEIGDARVESRETVVPEIRIEGDPGPRVQSQGVRNITAALPEFLSEPFDRATRDPDSLVGGALRGVIDQEIVPRRPAPSWLPEALRRRVDSVPRSIGQAASNESLDAAETFGERGLDAIPLGFGDELGTGIRLGMDPDYTTPRQQERALTPGLEADPLESDRDRYLRERRERTARNPASSVAGTVAGSLPSAVLTPGPTSTSAVGRIAQATGINALAGTVMGAGLSEEDELMGRAEDAIEGGMIGGALGGGGQVIGEGLRAGRTAWQAFSNPTGAALDAVRPPVAASLRLTEGDDAARAAERMLARNNADDAARLGSRAADAAPEMPPGTRAGQFNDDVTLPPAPGEIITPTREPRPWYDEDFITEPHDSDFAHNELPRRMEAMRRDAEGTGRVRARVADDVTEVTPMLADEADVMIDDAADLADDVTMLDEGMPDDVDEIMGEVVERPRRPAPTMPEQGPDLRAAAMRGQRARGSARGDAAADPSIQATRELSEMAREYSDIEGGVGGFQQLKNRRIAEAMQAEPPPEGWQQRSQEAIDAMAARLDGITRRAGANSAITGQVGRARFALDEAQTLLRASEEMGRPTSPAEVWRQLNNANMGVGRAAAQEARGFGSGVQHTGGFSEPLTQSYQQMRGFLADPDTWGAAAARVQREMNQSTAPLLRTGRALSDRVGRMFADSGEQAANGGGFRTYEEARPEAVRGLMARAGDDAYESERQLLRAWVENYGEQGATLARIAEDPALQAPARAMQQRAARLLDILDQAEIDGRAASMLESIGNARPFMRGPTVDQMVRLAARIESGAVTAPEMRNAMAALETLEGALSRPGAVGGTYGRAVDTAETAMLSAPVELPPADEDEDRPHVPEIIRRRRDMSMPTSTPQPLRMDDEEQRFNPFARVERLR